MPTQEQKSVAPKKGIFSHGEDAEYAELETLHFTAQEHHNILTLTKQLYQMIIGVQLHRGMSMSLLAGGDIFEKEILQLQRRLERRLMALEIFAREIDGLLSDHDRESLANAWMTIRHDWHQDNLIDNFELHSHFIQQLLEMINALAQKLIASLGELQSSHGSPAESNTVYPRAFKQIEVLNFIAQQVPSMTEMIAKIRGLASHAATAGEVEYIQDRKLRYLIQCAREQNEKLRHQSERLGTLTDGHMPSLSNIKTFELKLLWLFDIVERDVLGGITMTANSHHLFKLSTEIMEAYSSMIDEGWTLVRRWLEQDMEGWIT